ncbi:hypothetical protein EDB19DRAFT_1907819 [Suillus lakei]|nr:hypothetical protein EDB19DRAFT_1907819 [Suillus lakei]
MSTPDHPRTVMAYMLVPPMPYTKQAAPDSWDASSDVTMEDLLADQDFLPDDSADSSSEFEPASDSGSHSQPSNGKGHPRGYTTPETRLPVVCDGGVGNILAAALQRLILWITPVISDETRSNPTLSRALRASDPPEMHRTRSHTFGNPSILCPVRSVQPHCHRLTASMPPLEPPAGLIQPIPGITPCEAYHCPIGGCNAWHTKGGLDKHRKKKHTDISSCDFKATEKRFMIRPFYNLLNTFNPLRMQPWTFVPGWSHLITSSAITTAAVKPAPHAAPPQAQFLMDLGWVPFVTQLHKDIRQEIARFPTPALANNPSPFSNPVLEEGLVRLSKLYKWYLFDANDFVKPKNDQLVYILTQGTRAHFTPLKHLASFSRYIRPVICCVSMILRFVHVHQKGKENLKLFDIFATKGQLAAALALYQRIINVHDKNGGTLTKLLHNLLVLLFRHEIKSIDKIACPTDVSLCLGSMVDENIFVPRNYITGSCAILQHNLFAILFQYACVLASNMPAFIPHDMDNFMKPLADCSLLDSLPVQ